MKKRLVLILAFCLTLCFFTGCGVDSEKTQRTNYANALCYYFQGLQGYTAVMYAEANESSKVLYDKINYLYILDGKSGWAYGCWGNLIGWVKTTEIQTIEDPINFPLPKFLTAEQKMQFLRATCMFNAYICRNSALVCDYKDTVKNEKELTYFHDAAFATYGDFDAALHSLFTQEYINADEKSYLQHNDRLYVINEDRGAYSVDVEGYTLTEMSEDKITFNANFLYTTDISEHRCTLPVVIVKTNDGWRFKDFTSSADDIRWINAMGSDFDPYEGAK